MNAQKQILQSLLIFVCLCAVLLLNGFFGGVIVGSLGASAFILFAAPKATLSSPRHIIGGYICGALLGVLWGFIDKSFVLSLTYYNYAHAVICAGAAALTVFVMVKLKLPHPPAAALAIGIADSHDYIVMAVSAMACVIFLCFVKYFFKQHLDNLF